MTRRAIYAGVLLIGIANAPALAEMRSEEPASAGGASANLPESSEKKDAPSTDQPVAAEAENRRDPFRPFTLSMAKDRQPATYRTPLEKYELRELTLTAVLWNLNPPRALVQDGSGMGFILTPGTLIGPNRGVVAAIEPTRVVVEEKFMDAYLIERVKREVIEIPEEERPQDAKRGRR